MFILNNHTLFIWKRPQTNLKLCLNLRFLRGLSRFMKCFTFMSEVALLTEAVLYSETILRLNPRKS